MERARGNQEESQEEEEFEGRKGGRKERKNGGREGLHEPCPSVMISLPSLFLARLVA